MHMYKATDWNDRVLKEDKEFVNLTLSNKYMDYLEDNKIDYQFHSIKSIDGQWNGEIYIIENLKYEFNRKSILRNGKPFKKEMKELVKDF